MGRYIDLNAPLSDDDREFLASRSREGEINVNDRQFGHLSGAEKDELRKRAGLDAAFDSAEEAEFAKQEADSQLPWDEDLVDKVAPLKVAELRAHLKKLGQPDDGNKEELQDRLLNFLQARRDEAAPADEDEDDDLDEDSPEG